MHHIPPGFHSVQAAINVDDVGGLIGFIKTVFSATELDLYQMPDGSIVHAEFQIGDSVVILGPQEDHAHPAKVFVYVPDVDATFALAVAQGAAPLQDPQDQFFGQRVARVRDQWSNLWVIATQVEAVSRAEAKQRFLAMF